MMHKGGMAHDLPKPATPTAATTPAFPMAMKVPRMTAGDGAENIVGFEVEHQMMQALDGPHVPRFVAAGDLSVLPYLVMEYVQGRTLDHWLDQRCKHTRASAGASARLGAAVANAAHDMHQQNAVHLDLKPANVHHPRRRRRHARRAAARGAAGLRPVLPRPLPRPAGRELREAVGSPAYMSPEQVVGVRGDPRSDIFAIGVMLYELATGELPFGAPSTQGRPSPAPVDGPATAARTAPRPARMAAGGDPALPGARGGRALPLGRAPGVRPDPARQVQVTERGRRLKGTGFRTHFKRWLRRPARTTSPARCRRADRRGAHRDGGGAAHDVTDATLYSLREAVRRSLGIRPGARLACVTIVAPRAHRSRRNRSPPWPPGARLRLWAQGIDLEGHQVSFHVIESGDVSKAIVTYARGNQVSLLVLGAATHGLQMQRLVATVPMKVVMDAPCNVLLVKQELPFGQLAEAVD
jgi:serine/threonine protein kinase